MISYRANTNFLSTFKHNNQFGKYCPNYRVTVGEIQFANESSKIRCLSLGVHIWGRYHFLCALWSMEIKGLI